MRSIAAGLDERVKAGVSQVPIADGRDWLRRMRSEHEWLDFRARVRTAARALRRHRQSSTLVPPREGIMVPTPERRTTSVKATWTAACPTGSRSTAPRRSWRTARSTSVAAIAPRALMLIAVEGRRGHAGGPRPARSTTRPASPSAWSSRRARPTTRPTPSTWTSSPRSSSSGSRRHLATDEVVRESRVGRRHPPSRSVRDEPGAAA